VNDNFIRTTNAIGLTASDIIALARNSFSGSFLSEAEKARHLAAIDDIVAASGFASASPAAAAAPAAPPA